MISAIYLPLLGLSGAFFPLHRLPAGLHELADVLPLSHLLAASAPPTAAVGRGSRLTGLLVTLARRSPACSSPSAVSAGSRGWQL